MNILAILGIGGALYAIFKPTNPQAPSQAIVDKATEIARLEMIKGVPQNIAVATAASQALAIASMPVVGQLQFKPGPDWVLLGVRRTVFMDQSLSDAIQNAKASGLQVDEVLGQRLYVGTKSETTETSYWAHPPQKAV